ncbi:MAG: SIS domain-containing protein [Candidatus Asgardarchaeia archaeon]
MSYVDSYFEKVVKVLKVEGRGEEKYSEDSGSLCGYHREKKAHTFLRNSSYLEYSHRRFQQGGEFYAYDGILDLALSVVNGTLRTTFVERLHGYAKVVADYHELKGGKTTTIISNSGIDAVPIEMAMIAKDRGMNVIILTFNS